MASFGKLTNAFLQASQETTIALANLNFDFSLIKYDAPKEYQGVGDALSKRRKAAAEDGAVHITARKLAALFSGTTPDAPNLIRAYGLRASEVAKLPAVNPNESAQRTIFADHVGADGTSIWAAATSGNEAVKVHLLACLLARIWRREEAVSLWCELVEQRKAVLQSAQSDNSVSMSDLTASRVDISRRHLDEWDSSARAWLQTADKAKEREHTQFKLFADNISLPVSNKTTVYEAIIEAWTEAMKALDGLIQGAPQRIDNGAVLLGLSAWHLYPDIYSVETAQFARQGDPLISSGGVITLGLKNRDDDHVTGVFWSLPLSRARYYGDPVVATRHTGVKESQVTFDDFTFVVLGSVIGGWQASDLNLDVCLGMIRSLMDMLARVSQFITLGSSDEAWLDALGAAAFDWSRSKDMAQLQLAKLIKFGQRGCVGFLSSDKERPPPVFGLTDLVSLLESFRFDNNGRVNLLRKWASMVLDPDVLPFCTIRYFAREEQGYSQSPAYTRVYRPDPRPTKRQKTGLHPLNHQSTALETTPHWLDGEGSVLEEDPYWEGFQEGDPEYNSKEDVRIPSGINERPERHRYVCGLSDLAAVYVKKSYVGKAIPRRHPNTLSVKDLASLIEDGDLTEIRIARTLSAIIEKYSNGHYFQSLRAFGTARQLYAGLDGARIDLQVTSRILGKARWWGTKERAAASLPTTLATIAYFETGGLDIDPDAIGDHTFALCHSNSIFVATSLLADPSDANPATTTTTTASSHPFTPMQRIIGNVGKPGLGFLVMPADPRVRKPDYGSWHMVSHAPYDGTTQDNFPRTSLHLSFTGYELPLDVGSRGRRDVSGYFLETAVSVYDGRDWVADVDVLTALRQWVTLPEPPPACRHIDTAKATPPPSCRLVSVDTWVEFLDPPTDIAVLRAHGNPVARLAAAALATRRFRKTLVLPDAMCWACHGHRILAAVDEKPQNVSSDWGREKEERQDLEMVEQKLYHYEEDDGDEARYAFDMPPVGEEEEGESGLRGDTRGGVILIQ